MIESITIPKELPEHPILDYAALLREGLGHLERMTDGQWTDFNDHDPGITILDVVCYALTDLGYRIFHEIPDLLANDGADARVNVFSAAEALTTRAVTLLDLRKAALDVEGVKNAWIEPVETPAVPLRHYSGARELSIGETGIAYLPDSQPMQLTGLYRVLIEKSDPADIDSALRRAVAARLHAERNLCEDFEEIAVLEPQAVRVIAGIEIGEFENGEEVLLKIYERLAAYISPAIPFLTLAQMRAAGGRPEDIFDGPALQRGFIDTAALAYSNRRRALQVSDVIRELGEIPGIRAVRRVRLTSGDATEAWSLPLLDNAAPAFDYVNSEIELYSRVSIKVPVDRDRVAATYDKRLQASRVFRPLPPQARDLPPPAGTDRNVGEYFPLQSEFPLAYGLGAGALPSSASDERKAQVNQLRGYLALFDQLLADQFALLAAVPALLSFRNDDGAAYPAQPVAAFQGEPDGTAAPLLPPKVEAGPADDASDAEAGWRRRNRLVNHLLARFGEDFADPHSLAAANRPPLAELVRTKQAFLRRFPMVSSARGTGCDYFNPPESSRPSGLEERVRLKLNLIEGDGEIFFLVEHILLRPIGDDAQQNVPFLAEAASADPFSLQVSFVFPAGVGRFQDPGFRQFVERTVREETPAHIIPYVHWLDGNDEAPKFDEVAKAYRAWVVLRREYVTERLNGGPGGNR